VSKVVRLLSVVAVVVLPSVVRPQIELSDSQQLIVIHGTVAADQQAAQKIGYAAIAIGFAGAPPETMRWLGVVEA